MRQSQRLMVPFLPLANMIRTTISIRSWLDQFHYSIWPSQKVSCSAASWFSLFSQPKQLKYHTYRKIVSKAPWGKLSHKNRGNGVMGIVFTFLWGIKSTKLWYFTAFVAEHKFICINSYYCILKWTFSTDSVFLKCQMWWGSVSPDRMSALVFRFYSKIWKNQSSGIKLSEQKPFCYFSRGLRWGDTQLKGLN